MALLASVGLYSQNANEPCCTIIDMAKEEGTFTIRDNHSGRIKWFKPDALEVAELKIGDTVDARFDIKKITSVKGISRSYELLDLPAGDTCCVIIKLDSASGESLWQIMAKNNATGENIHFNVPRSLAIRLSAGGIVFSRPSHGYAMIAAALSDTTEKFLFGFPMLQE